jgi:hypothetical protein
MSPQITTRKMLMSDPILVRRYDPAETKETGGVVVVFVVNEDEGTENAPLVGSPTKNIFPPIGELRPTVFTN